MQTARWYMSFFCDSVLVDGKEENFMDRLTGFDKVCAKALI